MALYREMSTEHAGKLYMDISFSANQQAPLEPGSWQLGAMEEAGDAGVFPEEYHVNKRYNFLLLGPS